MAAAEGAAPAAGAAPPVAVRRLGRVEYRATWEAMIEYTGARGESGADELWIVEHPPVFTLGQAGRREHLLAPGEIPVIPVDRGGQVTYHGPGQVVIYLLLDLRRAGLGVKRLVELLEEAVIDLLAEAGVPAARRERAPGVYVDGRKVAALGLRVRRGCTYHGLALNVRMDLEPFSRINPCGYAGLQVTQLADLGLDWSAGQAAEALLERLLARLGRTAAEPAPR